MSYGASSEWLRMFALIGIVTVVCVIAGLLPFALDYGRAVVKRARRHLRHRPIVRHYRVGTGTLQIPAGLLEPGEGEAAMTRLIVARLTRDEFGRQILVDVMPAQTVNGSAPACEAEALDTNPSDVGGHDESDRAV